MSTAPRVAHRYTFLPNMFHSERNPGFFKRYADWLAVAFLLVGVIVFHGQTLSYGFWLDDHNHLELCQQCGWHELGTSYRFDFTGRTARVWWAQNDTEFAYFRPVSVALRKSLLLVFGLQPLPFHVVHLSIFAFTVILFYLLLRRLHCGPITGLIACSIFAFHPANVLTVSWLSADGPMLVGLWTVLALWFMLTSVKAGHRRVAPLVCVFLTCWLAMMSRENGIMVLPLLVIFDGAWTWCMRQHPEGAPSVTWRRRGLLYATLLVQGVLFVMLRSAILHDAPIPHKPYVHWPSEADFFSWLPFKLLNDLLCLPLGLPLLPVVSVTWWQSKPWTAAFAVVALLLLVMMFVWPLRRSRAMWAVLAGTALVLAPTVPVFSVAYNFYLVTAGWAILVALWARHLWDKRPRLVATTLVGLGAIYLVGFGTTTWTVFSAMTGEKWVRRDVMASDVKDAPQQTKLFFINLPFLAGEIGPALRLDTGRPDLEVYTLTYTPSTFIAQNDVELIRENDRTLLVRSKGKPWFSGTFGAAIQLGFFGASRRNLAKGPFPIHPNADVLPFRVDIVEADNQGVRALRFVFECSLDDPEYRFFVGSADRCAQEVRFSQRGTQEVPHQGAIAHTTATKAATAQETIIDPRRQEDLRDLHNVQRYLDFSLKVLTEATF